MKTRNIMLLLALLFGALPLAAQDIPVADVFTHEAALAQEAAAWAMLPAILARIQEPTFPDRDCVVTDFGASADSTSADDRPGIQATGMSCAASGTAPNSSANSSMMLRVFTSLLAAFWHMDQISLSKVNGSGCKTSAAPPNIMVTF